MNPRVKSHVYLATTPDGVYVGGGQESLYIAGRGIGPVLSRLLAMLDGTSPAEGIEKALPERIVPIFRLLLDGLQARRLVQDATADTGTPPTAEEWALFGDTLRYLRDFTLDYAKRFRAWRQCPVHVAGSGYALKSLVRGLADSGVAQMSIAVEHEAPVSADEITRSLRERQALDPSLRFEQVGVATFADAVGAGAGRVLYAADALAPETGALAAILASGREEAIVGGVFDNCGLISACWRSDGQSILDLRRRLVGRTDSVPHSVTSCSLIGAAVAFTALRSIVGEGLAPLSLLRVTPDGAISHHRIFDAAIGGYDAVGDPAAFEAHSKPLFDPVVGLFDWDEDETTYVPLMHATVALRTQAREDRRARIVAWGRGVEDARADAILGAVEAYADQLEHAAGLERPGRVVADYDADRWRARATALAIAHSPLLAQRGRTVSLPLESIDAPTLRVLIRFARVLDSEPMSLEVSFVQGLPCYVASGVSRGERILACAPTALEAVSRVAGEVCSRLQQPRRGARSFVDCGAERLAPPPPGGAMAFADIPVADASLDAFGYEIEDAPFTLDDALGRAGLKVGGLRLVGRHA